MNNNIPTMTLVCGCNGAGKSTLTYATIDADQNVFYIDPDRIAKEKGCSPLQAGKIAVNLTNDYLADKQPFLKESTLSSKSDLKLLERAKEAGFKTEVRYVGLKNADKAVQRVADRHQKGGHTVPEDDIRRRYERSLENLPKAIARADEVKIFDNTKNDYAHVATFKNGQLESQSSLPDWFKGVEKQL